jgi:hypothetical protein
MDGLGELAGAPGAAAELAENLPGLELCVRTLAGRAEFRVGAVVSFCGTSIRLKGDLACLSVSLAMSAEDAVAEPGGVG